MNGNNYDENRVRYQDYDYPNRSWVCMDISSGISTFGVPGAGYLSNE